MSNVPTYQHCCNEVSAGRVTCRPSLDGRYEVFNYCETVEFDDTWNDINVWCRGIVFDVGVLSPVCVAVPFRKFWNVGQRPETRIEALAALGDPVDVREKIDGSLGIVFVDAFGQLRVSTRGSLESDQAHWATTWINDPVNCPVDDGSRDGLRFAIEALGLTPLVEIVYDENRIVVPYDHEGLVALAMVERASGRVLGLEECGRLFPQVWCQSERHAVTSVDALLTLAESLPWNHEGWVVRWADGTMAKVKGEEYKRIHRIRFGMSPKRIHEALIEGTDPGAVEGYPDEFMTELRQVRDAIVAAYDRRMLTVRAVLEQSLILTTRRDKALLAKEQLPVELLSTFFALLDGDTERARRVCMASIDPNVICVADAAQSDV